MQMHRASFVNATAVEPVGRTLRTFASTLAPPPSSSPEMPIAPYTTPHTANPRFSAVTMLAVARDDVPNSLRIWGRAGGRDIDEILFLQAGCVQNSMRE